MRAVVLREWAYLADSSVQDTEDNIFVDDYVK